MWKPIGRVSTEASVFTRRERDGIDYFRSSPNAPWQAANIDRLNFTGVEVMTAIALGHQRLELGYTGIYGVVEPTSTLVSKYVRNYPVHQATTEWLGELSRRVQMRVRIGVTNRYGQGAYPMAELATTKSFGRLRPYLKVSNITNTGYEEVEGVRMPGRAYVAGLELRVGH